MKVNLSAAMRARDVSRPRPDQLAEAEAAEASIADSSGGPRGNSAVADAPGGGAREASGAPEGNGARRGENAWDVTGSRVRHVASAKARDGAEARDSAGARDGAGARDAAGAVDGGEEPGREGQERRAARVNPDGTRKRRMPRNSPRRGRRADL